MRFTDKNGTVNKVINYSYSVLISLYKHYFEKHDGAYIKASLYSCRLITLTQNVEQDVQIESEWRLSTIYTWQVNSPIIRNNLLMSNT